MLNAFRHVIQLLRCLKREKLLSHHQKNIASFDELAQVFLQEKCPVQQLYENGINKPILLSNLPPTYAAAHQNIYRDYY